MFEDLNANDDSCIISDKLKGRLNADTLEKQDRSVLHELYADDDIEYDNSIYAQLNLKNKNNIQCVIDKIIFNKQDIVLTIFTTIDNTKLLMSKNNLISSINIVNFDNSSIEVFDSILMLKKSLKFKNDKYIKVKLKFRK